MSFGDKRLDKSYDDWVTKSPDDYFDRMTFRRKIKIEILIKQIDNLLLILKEDFPLSEAQERIKDYLEKAKEILQEEYDE